jgi:hypothetical protein
MPVMTVFSASNDEQGVPNRSGVVVVADDGGVALSAYEPLPRLAREQAVFFSRDLVPPRLGGIDPIASHSMAPVKIHGGQVLPFSGKVPRGLSLRALSAQKSAVRLAVPVVYNATRRVSDGAADGCVSVLVE